MCFYFYAGFPSQGSLKIILVLKPDYIQNCKTGNFVPTKQKSPECSGLFFVYINLDFYSKTKFTLTLAVISISPIARVSLEAVESIDSTFIAYILGGGL